MLPTLPENAILQLGAACPSTPRGEVATILRGLYVFAFLSGSQTPNTSIGSTLWLTDFRALLHHPDRGAKATVSQRVRAPAVLRFGEGAFGDQAQPPGFRSHPAPSRARLSHSQVNRGVWLTGRCGWAGEYNPPILWSCRSFEPPDRLREFEWRLRLPVSAVARITRFSIVNAVYDRGRTLHEGIKSVCLLTGPGEPVAEWRAGFYLLSLATGALTSGRNEGSHLLGPEPIRRSMPQSAHPRSFCFNCLFQAGALFCSPPIVVSDTPTTSCKYTHACLTVGHDQTQA